MQQEISSWNSDTSLERKLEKWLILVSNANLGESNLHLLKIVKEEKIEFSSGYDPLHLAVIENRIELVKYMIDHKFDLESTNQRGQTALLLACGSGNIKVAKMLLKAGANVNATDWSNLTPVTVAIEENHTELALHLAAAKGQLMLVKILVEKYHFRTEDSSKEKATALAYAVNQHNADIVEYLIDKGASVGEGILDMALQREDVTQSTIKTI